MVTGFQSAPSNTAARKMTLYFMRVRQTISQALAFVLPTSTIGSDVRDEVGNPKMFVDVVRIADLSSIDIKKKITEIYCK